MVKSVVYQCCVTNDKDSTMTHYIGSTSTTFKSRFYQHKESFGNVEKRSKTVLSDYIWRLKESGANPCLAWSIIDRVPPYSNGSRRCPLCLAEKTNIAYAKVDLLNKRSEIVSKCRHENKYILKNFKGIKYLSDTMD